MYRMWLYEWELDILKKHSIELIKVENIKPQTTSIDIVIFVEFNSLNMWKEANRLLSCTEKLGRTVL